MPPEPSRGMPFITLAKRVDASDGSMALSPYSSCLPSDFHAPDSTAAIQGCARSLMLNQMAYSRCVSRGFSMALKTNSAERAEGIRASARAASNRTRGCSSAILEARSSSGFSICLCQYESTRVAAARISKIHFAMLNDRVGPIRNIKRSIRAKFHVNWPKRHVGAADKKRHLFRDVGGALFIDGESYHAIGAEIARDHLSLPIFRELFAVDDFKAAEFWI